MAIMMKHNNKMMMPNELIYRVIELLGSDPVWWLLPPKNQVKEEQKGVADGEIKKKKMRYRRCTPS